MPNPRQDVTAPALSVGEIAALLGCSPRTVRREIHRGNLRAFRVGRAVRVTRQALYEYIDGKDES